MDQKGLTQHVAAATGLTPGEAARVAEALGAAVAEALSQGTSVAVAGFGTFEPRLEPERVDGGRLMPPSVRAEFVTGAALRRQLARR